MSMDPNGQCSEAVNNDRTNDSPSRTNLSNDSVSNSEAEDESDTDEEEDEDIDFNPFLKESPSLEAASSLSSENEGLIYVTPDTKDNAALATNILWNPSLQQEAVNEYVDEKESKNDSDTKSKKKRKLALISNSDPGRFNESLNGLGTGIETGKDVTGEGTSRCQKLFDTDDNDAICRRTRARCSLARFTLDELETFLQETDDEDDFKNVDDEEEYKKFLAAVLLQGGDGGAGNQENENDDEDEDSDADFELELEEALESDLDENIKLGLQEELKLPSPRPKTRQNKHRAAKLGAGNPLRPANRALRPILPSAPVSSFPVLSPPNHVFSSKHSGTLNGFSPYQLAQLHCLIYEHTQLLIQVYCLSIFEPSRKHIASQIQEFLMEMLHKRDQAIHLRRNSCASDTVQSSDISSMEKHQYASNRHGIQTQTSDSNVLPSVHGLIHSVLDITPLNLVGNFIDDVNAAMQEYQQKYIQATCDDNPVEKDPLFPFQIVQSSSQADTEAYKGTIGQSAKSPSFPSDCPPKRTLAATIVEKTKKQSIALVPKSIAKLTQRFYPLFNPALFPHKAPPASVANRVLFTDAEDELLALGLMEYNTDWETIQKRFLPCKSKHQIFVRQKNRSSSKAPENSIKAIRRMKNSPLTVDEVARIQEGLKVFKHDWMSVWKFVVPYRDPSLLPRQWRIANGTQKSYKATADKKEKRRLYALNKKNPKPALLDCHTNAAIEENSGVDCVDNQDESYVHEAFLADWRPSTSIPLPSEVSMPIMERNQPNHLLLQDTSHLSERITNDSTDSPSKVAFKVPTGFVSGISMSSSHSSQRYSNSNGGHTSKSTLVKLAPGLPPVNLPPSVRVISQSALTGNHQVLPLTIMLPPKTGVLSSTSEEIISALPQFEASGKRKSIGCPPEFAAMKNKPLQSNSCLSDIDMHPLFFQPQGDDQFPYYPPNSGNLATCLTSISGNQPQLNLSLNLVQNLNLNLNLNLKPVMSKAGSSSSPADALDFHPLLQKESTNNDLLIGNSGNQISSVNPETLREVLPPRQSKRKGILRKPRDHSSPKDQSQELDLDIRLSSTPRKNVVTAGPEQNLTRSALDSSVVRSTTEHETRKCHRQSESMLDSVPHALVISDDNVAAAACGVNDEVLQPAPEIVMEQEELSDSDEEIGEDVEFEHEEMTD